MIDVRIMRIAQENCRRMVFIVVVLNESKLELMRKML